MTKCNRCKHDWQTKSTHIFVTCPSCYKKVKVRELVKEQEHKEVEEVSLEDDLDDEEKDFIKKYEVSGGSALVIQKGVDQFGADRVKVLLKTIKKEVVENAPQGQ